MKLVALLLLACLALVGAAEDRRATPARKVAASLLAAYVFVHNGSGVVVSADGLVLTNHHVIDGEPVASPCSRSANPAPDRMCRSPRPAPSALA